MSYKNRVSVELSIAKLNILNIYYSQFHAHDTEHERVRACFRYLTFCLFIYFSQILSYFSISGCKWESIY